ncbi:hypothetical protein ncot_18720 [Nocardioides sp. JQ2195]|uniref:glycoside hydrolase family 25 protein n=1 Tax=Nocardioides sp. JQ2195 TaxID=2592334 RepID=UPI00143ED518|nr:GH25 family lysozyme [Nocardioides sp. JQ2195]QIX28397.1 hypothetical protein ncot_18720 [Nocardioides sp. JQ2195]
MTPELLRGSRAHLAPVAVALLVIGLAAGCGSAETSPPDSGSSASVASAPTSSSTPSVVEEGEAVVEEGEAVVEEGEAVVEEGEERARLETRARPETRAPSAGTLQGIDVSHHQGAIDWDRVAGDGIDFAYLKATEGGGFTDDRFVSNASSAHRAGLRVGGYHYYTLCSPPEPQAAHFVDVLAQARTDLPPVVDLELIGNCDPPPDRATLRADVETFVDRVEDATGTEVVVYFHPDFEVHYAMVDDLDRRLWVRRVGSTPPPGDWFIWQRDDAGSVDGVSTPVDRDVMRP